MCIYVYIHIIMIFIICINMYTCARSRPPTGPPTSDSAAYEPALARKGTMGSALIGSLLMDWDSPSACSVGACRKGATWSQHQWDHCKFCVFWQRDFFLGSPVNLLLFSQKCRVYTFFANLSKNITFAAAPLVLTPFDPICQNPLYARICMCDVRAM